MYRFALFAAFAALLCSCKPDAGLPRCPLDDVVPTPADGAEHVLTNTWTHVELPEVVEHETGLTMYANGDLLLGATTWDDFAVYFQPDGWFLPAEAEIEVWLERAECADELVSTFTTSKYGERFEAGCLDDKVFLIDLMDAEILQPGTGPEITDNLESALLLRINRSDNGQLQATAAFPRFEPLRQDTCVETIELPVIDLDNPGFSGVIPQLDLAVDGLDVTFYDVDISGYFSADCEETGDGRIYGKLRTDALDALLGGDFCGLAAALDIACEPCPHGGGQCITLEAEQVSGEAVDVDVIDISPAQADDC